MYWIPACAGMTVTAGVDVQADRWIPAFAGMTEGRFSVFARVTGSALGR